MAVPEANAGVKGKAIAVLSAAILMAGLLPLPAFAVPTADGEPANDAESMTTLALEAGSYVEHEAIAYVTKSSAGASPRSRAADLLSGAQDLMEVDGEAAACAVGADASDAPASASARSLSSEGGVPEGRLVLVHDESLSTEELIVELQADPRVAFVEPNLTWDAPDESVPTGSETDASAAGEQTERDGSSFDLTSYQWAFDNTGTLAGAPEQEVPDIDYAAWEQAAESGDWAGAAAQERAAMPSDEPVVVAVVDSGVDETNPDLAGILWDDGLSVPALAELGGDAHGLSTYDDPAATSTTGIPWDEGHGTHVAGIIAGAWDGAGVSGVAPNAEIMSVRLDFSLANALEAFNYIATAADAGVNVRVANCSWTLGASASRSLDVAVRQMGSRGVVSVFASGNDNSDVDRTMGAPSLLRDNPYIVGVDSIDPTGEKSSFSCYGVSSTDVMAPGAAILSTYLADSPSYFGEADVDAALYESFDGATRASADTGLSSGSPQLSFSYAGEGASGAVDVQDGVPRFEGSSSLALSYDADVANPPEEILQVAGELAGYQAIVSDPIDLSQVAETPRYLSIRYASSDPTGQANVWLAVREAETGEMLLVGDPRGGFGATGTEWGGGYYELPDTTDFEHFQIMLLCCNRSVSLMGGQSSAVPADATIYIDGIGIGDGLAPYAYLQGTSMAAPVVSGIAAVAAGRHPDDSAARLAARVKGSAQVDDRYADLCSTGGLATVSGTDDPAPVPLTAAAAADGRSAAIQGYFVPEDVQVSIGGVPCAVLSRSEVGADGLVELSVALPEGFAGGEQWLVLQAANGRGRLYADFGEQTSLTYYEQASLPVPEETEQWSDWQLVGYAGDVYALPRESVVSAAQASHPFFLRFDVETQTWSRISFPLEQLAELGVTAVASASATPFEGALVMQITGNDAAEGSSGQASASYWRYYPDGTWEHVPVELPESESLMLSTLATDGERLYAFGGYGVFDEEPLPGLEMVQGTVSSIALVDLDQGTASVIGVMPTRRYNPQVAYRDGVFLVAGGQGDLAQAGSVMGVDRVVPLAQDEVRHPEDFPWLDVTYPAGWLSGAPVDCSGVVTETGKCAFAPAAAKGGFMLAGPRSDDGRADTYTLAGEEGATPQAFERNASYRALLNPSAVAYDGMLYVLAAASGEPDRVFAATSVETVPTSGDYVVPDPEPGPEPDPTPGDDSVPADDGASDSAGESDSADAPDPTDTSDSEGGSDSAGMEEGGSLKPLASTGDPAGAALPVVLAGATVAGIGAAAAGRASRRKR